jgi:hypothetical protein
MCESKEVGSRNYDNLGGVLRDLEKENLLITKIKKEEREEKEKKYNDDLEFDKNSFLGSKNFYLSLFVMLFIFISFFGFIKN